LFDQQDASDGIMVMNRNDSELGRPLPIEEANQPDPMLQMSAGRVGAGGMTLVAVAAAAIVGLVLYGLNAGGGPEQTASTAPGAQQAPAGNSGATKPGAAQSNEHGGNG
jgi:hypothetical protein